MESLVSKGDNFGADIHTAIPNWLPCNAESEPVFFHSLTFSIVWFFYDADSMSSAPVTAQLPWVQPKHKQIVVPFLLQS